MGDASLPVSYDPSLVALSILIATVAAYTALELGDRGSAGSLRARFGWIAGAAVAMGGGIWAMHFVGMLAFVAPVPIAYAPGRTVLSLAVAVAATAAAFLWVTWPLRRAALGRNARLAAAARVGVAGLLLGVAIAGMHYIGMSAMEMPLRLSFDAGRVVLSVVIAVVASVAGLSIAFRRHSIPVRIGASVVMGLAVSGMHYTGMWAAHFSRDAAAGLAHADGAAHGGGSVGPAGLALSVVLATFMILFLAMLASSLTQHRSQRLLRQSEARFRVAAEAVGDIIWTNTAEGRMAGPQPDWARFTGQAQADYEGFGWARAIHPDDVQPTQLAWAETVRTRSTFQFEHRVRRFDGAWRLCSVRAVPVLDDAGALAEWVGVHEDITERDAFELALKEARDAAEEHSRAKSRFLANMSHELRTPLSAVIGYSEMLEEEAEELGQESLLKDLGKIKSNAQHLLGLINDVLDLSKVEAEKMDLDPEDIDVADFATDAAGTVDALVGKRGNVLVLDITGDVGRARTDAVKLRQCLFNLLSNAAKFTEGGTITLRVGRETGIEGDRLRFTVEDTGIGMSPEQVGRLFERFTQADETTTRRFGGTGLGRALSRAFAQLMGGDITVESVEGRGTSFTLRVPALAPNLAIEETPTEGHGNEAPSGDLVLVIDDEASQRDLMTRFLERQRFAVRTAGDGRTGLDLARALRPRAILLDVMMPEMDGWSVLAALKSDPDLAGIPVVMVSFVADTALSASLGAVEAVPKPVDWTRLKSIMEQFRVADGDVLVVDDDPDMRDRLRAVLERNGWAVREAANGCEALDQVKHGVPRLVLLDLTMPVMDGFSFLDRLRVLPGCAEVPVVVLSARDVTAEERERLSEADRVLRKGDASLQDIAMELRKIDNRHVDDGEVGTAGETLDVRR